MLTNLELGKLCVQVQKHRCTDVLTTAQESELGTFFESIHLWRDGCACKNCSFSRGSLIHIVVIYTVDFQGVFIIVLIEAEVDDLPSRLMEKTKWRSCKVFVISSRIITSILYYDHDKFSIIFIENLNLYLVIFFVLLETELSTKPITNLMPSVQSFAAHNQFLILTLGCFHFFLFCSFKLLFFFITFYRHCLRHVRIYDIICQRIRDILLSRAAKQGCEGCEKVHQIRMI